MQEGLLGAIPYSWFPNVLFLNLIHSIRFILITMCLDWKKCREEKRKKLREGKKIFLHFIWINTLIKRKEKKKVCIIFIFSFALRK